MNFPLPFFVLIFAGTGGNESCFEIYLNRSGINSIDLPREKIQAATGNNLKVKFVNRGAPIHITITSLQMPACKPISFTRTCMSSMNRY
jgi:hypothetical protein